MARSSTNLSERLWAAVHHFDETLKVGELDGRQPVLLDLTHDESVRLRDFLNEVLGE